jgi:hypothetical protein
MSKEAWPLLPALNTVAALVLLSGCSTVGPGFTNHPADCAIGIPWADCLPGTPGYNNGGGRLYRDGTKRQADEPGSTLTPAGDDPKYTKLVNLKRLLDNGVLSKEEFEREKAKILSQP